jgi:predicted TPR repeat methyltransferase
MSPAAHQAQTIFSQAQQFEMQNDIRSAVAKYEEAERIAPKDSQIALQAGSKAINLKMQHGIP